MTVDLSSVVQSVIGLCAVAITVLGGIVLKVLAAKLGVQLTAAQTATFDDALAKSVTYGATAATAEIKAKGWDHPEVKNAVLAEAATYAVDKFPVALSGVGLSTNLNDPANAAAIESALQRAFPAAMTKAAASPATPPVTPPAPAAPTIVKKL